MTTPTSSVTNDLQWPQNLGKHAGTHKTERDYHERLLGPQKELQNPRRPGPLFVDVWRLIKGPSFRQYTYSGKKMGGWRRAFSPSLSAPPSCLPFPRHPPVLSSFARRTDGSFPLVVDGFIVSERFLHRVRMCEIRQEVKYKFWPEKDIVGRGALSDHWPVLLSLEMAEL
jgi:exonuclease III